MTSIALLVALHAYIGLRLIPDAAFNAPALVFSIAMLVASVVMIPLAMMLRRVPRTLADRLAWIGFVFMGLFSTFFVLTLLRDLVLLACWLLLPEHLNEISRITALSAMAAAFAITAIGLINARRPARVVAREIPIRDLSPALQGFSIAQISDVHVGATIKRNYVERIVATVNSLNADAIAVTGDIVDGSVRDLEHHVAPLANLRARYGAYFVTGNHEYYSGEAAWSREFRRLGMMVLINEHVVLKHNGATLVLAGVADYTAHHFNPAHKSDPMAALRGSPEADAKVLLAHQPRSAQAAAAAGYDLQLSGHTHGGQFWPWNHFVRFQQPYTAGLHRLNKMWVYISRGTGYWGPPKRFGAPSEISLLRLVRA